MDRHPKTDTPFSISPCFGNKVSNIQQLSLLELRQYIRNGNCATLIIDGGILQHWMNIHKHISNQSDALNLLLGKDIYKRKKIIILPGGETGKNRTSFDLLLACFFEHKLTRKDAILGIGGGAFCDTVSYAASVYLRGITLLLVPSTLLSMVDASIGGKTAINYNSWKNMVGTFYPPTDILIVPELLAEAPSHIFKEGIAEILKAGMLLDETILDIIEEQGISLITAGYAPHAQTWHRLIWKAIMVKCSIVEQDFKEENIRAYLNLGHTFAHAQESCAITTGLSVSHGDAVGLGIRASLHLSMRIYNTTSTAQDSQKKEDVDILYVNRIFKLLDILDFPRNYTGYYDTQLLKAMQIDKKRSAHGIRCILQTKQSNTMLTEVSETDILQVLRALGAEKNE